MVNGLESSFVNNKLTLLHFDGIMMGFSQSQILTVENLNQMDTLQATNKSSGTLIYLDSNLPVYTLNHNLMLMDQPATGNNFCIAIEHPDKNESFALMCDSVNQSITEESINIIAMPPLMHNPDSPVIGLLKSDNSLVLISDAESMRAYINTQEKKDV